MSSEMPDAVPRYVRHMGALYVVADMIHVTILRNAPSPCAYSHTGWAHRVTDDAHLGACSCRPMIKRDALCAYEQVCRDIERMTHQSNVNEVPI